MIFLKTIQITLKYDTTEDPGFMSDVDREDGIYQGTVPAFVDNVFYKTGMAIETMVDEDDYYTKGISAMYDGQSSFPTEPAPELER